MCPSDLRVDDTVELPVMNLHVALQSIIVLADKALKLHRYGCLRQ
jgi:hypothetical protein